MTSATFQEYKDYIARVAQRFYPGSGIELDELQAAGVSGLNNAIHNFDDNRGPFDWFAKRCIVQEITKAKDKSPLTVSLTDLPCQTSSDPLIEILPSNISKEGFTLLRLRQYGYTEREMGEMLGISKQAVSRKLLTLYAQIREANA